MCSELVFEINQAASYQKKVDEWKAANPDQEKFDSSCFVFSQIFLAYSFDSMPSFHGAFEDWIIIIYFGRMSLSFLPPLVFSIYNHAPPVEVTIRGSDHLIGLIFSGR